jgi:hypothetical protein
VVLIPAADFDRVSVTMTWRCQRLDAFERSDVLPGFLGWFTLSEPQAEPAAEKPQPPARKASTPKSVD